MSDQTITCSECGGSFIFTESEQSFFATKGLSGPKRCKPCRLARKAQNGDAGPPRGRSFGGGAGNGGPPRGPRSFDRGDSRGNSRDAGGPPRGRGGDAGGSAGGWGRLGGGAPDPRQPRFAQQDRTGGFAPRGPGSFDGARPAPSFRDRGPSDPRASRGGAAPRTGESRDPRRRDAAPGASADQPRAPRRIYDAPKNAFRARSAGNDRPPTERPPREVAPARVAKPKAERPKFDVTCIECGTGAQVPFKPIDGRDVFCQPCYRARRGIVAPAGEVLEATETDSVD